MKHILFLIAASALLFSSCKETPPETPLTPESPSSGTPLTGIDFAEPALTLMEGGNATLTVVFTPADATNKNITWENLNEDIVTLGENGAVTAVAEGLATITVTAEDGEHTATCVVTVSWLGRASFRTDKTWTVGTQTWSDAVMAERCAGKEDYSGVYASTDHVTDCRENGAYGHLFSWMAVSTYAAQLCPEPWRTPVSRDFIDLDIALGGDGTNKMADMHINNYVDPEMWGGEHGGYCWVNDADELIVQSQGAYGLYWSGESANRNNAAILLFGIDPEAYPPDYGASSPAGTSHKNNGATLRCIR
jgi:uncharacterized protein (TIGR02145 family)